MGFSDSEDDSDESKSNRSIQVFFVSPTDENVQVNVSQKDQPPLPPRRDDADEAPGSHVCEVRHAEALISQGEGTRLSRADVKKANIKTRSNMGQAGQPKPIRTIPFPQ